MIFNVNIGDSLTNGSLGKITDIVVEHEKVKAVIVDFDDENSGIEQRENNKELIKVMK